MPILLVIEPWACHKADPLLMHNQVSVTQGRCGLHPGLLLLTHPD